jgi:hypothetical protein
MPWSTRSMLEKMSPVRAIGCWEISKQCWVKELKLLGSRGVASASLIHLAMLQSTRSILATKSPVLIRGEGLL